MASPVASTAEKTIESCRAAHSAAPEASTLAHCAGAASTRLTPE